MTRLDKYSTCRIVSVDAQMQTKVSTAIWMRCEQCVACAALATEGHARSLTGNLAACTGAHLEESALPGRHPEVDEAQQRS